MPGPYNGKSFKEVRETSNMLLAAGWNFSFMDPPGPFGCWHPPKHKTIEIKYIYTIDFKEDEGLFVLGVKQEKLPSKSARKVAFALREAGDFGLSAKQMKNICGDAIGVFKRLRASSPEWTRLLQDPVRGSHGYRMTPLSVLNRLEELRVQRELEEEQSVALRVQEPQEGDPH